MIEKILVSIVMKLVDKLASFLLGRARASKLHKDDQEEFRERAKIVEQQSEIIKNAIKKKQVITKDMADKLKERNAKLRSGGLL